MQKSQNKNNPTLFDAPPSQHFFQDKPNENNQRQNTQQSTDLDTPNKENESKNPQKNLSNNNNHNNKKNKQEDANNNYSKDNENWKSKQNQNKSMNKQKTEETYNEKPSLQRQKSSTSSARARKEKSKLNTPNFLRTIQKQTNFSAVYVILPILSCCICVYFGFMEVFITNLIGIIYPIYWSMRALDIDINSKDEEKQWYTYWLIFLGMLPIDMLIGRFLRHIPLLYFAKYVFLCWLFLPNFYGASYIHDRLIRKNLPQFEIVYRIDNASTSIKKEFKDFTTRLQHKMLESNAAEGHESFKRKRSKGSERKGNAKNNQNYNLNQNQNQQENYESYERQIGQAEIEENRRPQMTKDKDEHEKEAQEETLKQPKEFSGRNKEEEEFRSMQQAANERISEQPQQQITQNKNNYKSESSESAERFKNNKKQNKPQPQEENIKEKTQSEQNPDQIKDKSNQQKREAEDEAEQAKKNESSNSSSNKFFEGSEAEKSDVSNVYNNLISHINDIKSRSGKTKDLINSTIEKIWGRLHEESLLRKGNQEKNLFDSETDKRRYEELIREKSSADSDKFGVATNKGFLNQEEQTRKFFEENASEGKDKFETGNVNEDKDFNDRSNKVELDKKIEKDYLNKDENFKVEGDRKIQENEAANNNDNNNNLEDKSENKENIQSENIDSKKQQQPNKKKEIKQQDEKKKEKQEDSLKIKEKEQMVSH